MVVSLYLYTFIFSENETKIKELMSKLAAIKETLNTETQTLEQSNVELLKEKDCLVSVTYFYFFYTFWIVLHCKILFFDRKSWKQKRRSFCKRSNSWKKTLTAWRLLSQIFKISNYWSKESTYWHCTLMYCFFLSELSFSRKKLKLYKDLIRIQWDYEASKHSIKGCILFLYSYM